MNVYRTQFSRRCPVNGDRIFYSLELSNITPVMAEDIEAAIATLPDAVLHEDAADAIAKALPGEQAITANHRSIHIETRRGEQTGLHKAWRWLRDQYSGGDWHP